VGAVSALILASTSVYRRELLARLGLPFEALPPGVSEAHLAGESPADRALRLALEKAGAVARAHPQAVVIGADQVAACADQLLECVESRDPTALIGLPLIWLAAALRDAGFPVP